MRKQLNFGILLKLLIKKFNRYAIKLAKMALLRLRDYASHAKTLASYVKQLIELLKLLIKELYPHAIKLASMVLLQLRACASHAKTLASYNVKKLVELSRLHFQEFFRIQ